MGGSIFDGLRRSIAPRYVLYLLFGTAALAPVPFLFRNLGCDLVSSGAFSVYLASSLVVLGWMVTYEISSGNSRSQHTVDLLTRYILDPVHDRDLETLKRFFSTRGNRIDSEMIPVIESEQSVYRALLRELNFLEFIASAYEQGTLNRKLLKDYLRSILLAAFDRCEVYIQHCSAGDSARIWSNLKSLRDRWDPAREQVWQFGRTQVVVAAILLAGWGVALLASQPDPWRPIDGLWQSLAQGIESHLPRCPR